MAIRRVEPPRCGALRIVFDGNCRTIVSLSENDARLLIAVLPSYLSMFQSKYASGTPSDDAVSGSAVSNSPDAMSMAAITGFG